MNNSLFLTYWCNFRIMGFILISTVFCYYFFKVYKISCQFNYYYFIICLAILKTLKERNPNKLINCIWNLWPTLLVILKYFETCLFLAWAKFISIWYYIFKVQSDTVSKLLLYLQGHFMGMIFSQINKPPQIVSFTRSTCTYWYIN